jgi:hypothetical protein
VFLYFSLPQLITRNPTQCFYLLVRKKNTKQLFTGAPMTKRKYAVEKIIADHSSSKQTLLNGLKREYSIPRQLVRSTECELRTVATITALNYRTCIVGFFFLPSPSSSHNDSQTFARPPDFDWKFHTIDVLNRDDFTCVWICHDRTNRW